MQLMVSDMQHVSPEADTPQNGDGDEVLIVVVVQAPELPDRRVLDALSYLDLVKACFKENPAVYQSFLGTMGDFKMNRSVCFSSLLQSPADLQVRIELRPWKSATESPRSLGHTLTSSLGSILSYQECIASKLIVMEPLQS
jgi:hypothetical protein